MAGDFAVGGDTEAVAQIDGRVWRNGRLTAEVPDEHELPSLLAQRDVLVWLDLSGDVRGRLENLVTLLELDQHSVEDAMERRERPKATRHPGHTFVTAYATSVSDNGAPGYASRLVLARVSAFVLPNVLITVRDDERFDMGQVLTRWDDNIELIQAAGEHAVGALLHGLLDVIVDGHFETIQHLDDAIESLEDLLFDDVAGTKLVQRHVYRVRKELVELRRVVLPMREVVNSVLRHRSDLGSSRELDGWYDDLYDHVLRASEWTESLRDMVTTLFETNLSLQDSHLNMVMKKLAGWAAIIAVPTAVTGWFGQNVPYPGFQEASGMWMSVALIVVCSVGLYALFRLRDWI